MDPENIIDLTPEPHFVPGYTGHCAQYRYRIGETYGHATHKALMEPVSCKYSGRLVISDVHQTVGELPQERGVQSLRERSKDLNAVYKVPFVPGYRGFVPRIAGTLGERFNVAASEAVAEFVECQRRAQCRRKQTQREAPGGEWSKHSLQEKMKTGTHFRHPLMEVRPEFSGLKRSASCSGDHPYQGIWPDDFASCPEPRNRRSCVPPPAPRCTVNLPPIDEMEEQPREEWYQGHHRDQGQCFDYEPRAMGRYPPSSGNHSSVCPRCPPCPPMCERCGLLSQHSREQVRQPLHPRPPPKNVCEGGRFVLADIRPDLAAEFLQDVPCPEPSFLPHDSTSPYFMEIGHPEKTFKHGYAGHEPFSHGAFGKSHDAQIRSQLAEFTTNYRRRQSQEWAPVEIGGIEAFPRVTAGPVIYPTHVGLIPKYGGHVPGETFRFGQTYGSATRDAKSWLRGDFS